MTEPTSGVLRIGILTVSDSGSRGERVDASGQFLAGWCAEEGHQVARTAVLPDRTDAIVPVLLKWADGGEVDVILTTGGTGFGPRDVTPEATRAVLDRPAPGLADAMRRAGEGKTLHASLSRGLTGARGRVLVANLPGSLGGVRDGMEVLGPLIRHTAGLMKGEETPHRQS